LPPGPLSEQNIKDRYYGVNDPVAAKLLDRANKMAKLTPPEDQTICTLFVGGVTGACWPGQLLLCWPVVLSARLQQVLSCAAASCLAWIQCWKALPT
jgi:hypothetical protein